MMRIFAALLLVCGVMVGQTAIDRLGRTTPKSSFMGFLRSTHDGNFARATRYMQFPAEMPEKDRVELARQLSVVMDRGFVGNLDTISAKPEGSGEDGLGPDQENIGALLGSEPTSRILMVRVQEQGQHVWLLSNEVVALTPQMFGELGFPQIENRLPRVLIDTHLLSMPTWVLLAVLMALPLAMGLAWLVVKMTVKMLPVRWGISTRPNAAAVAFIGVVLHNLFAQLLGLPLLYRVWYTRLLIVLWLALYVWLIFNAIGYADKRVREYLLKNQLHSTQSVLSLGRRLVQMLVLLGAVLIGMRGFGYDITAALAGLGIGGLAIAFAAQKTLENVFGGLSLLSDQSIRVGDSCMFGQVPATVEDIGLRATRFRTVNRSVMFIPNGQLATMTIENMGLRDKILFRHTIGVKYGLDRGEMEGMLGDLRKLIEEDSRIGADGRRVQFLKFGAYSLDIEIFCYVMTSDYAEFLRIQEELLLKVMDIVKRHDSDFAFPSQTLYVEQGKLELGTVMAQEGGHSSAGGA